MHKHGFYVTNLGRDRIILRHPWFKTFNLTIHWGTDQLEGNDVVIEMAGYCVKQCTPTARQLTINPLDVEAERVEILKQILEEYCQHWQVFSEKASHWYPPARD